MSSDDEVREEKELDLSSSDVVTKYKDAADIINSNKRLSILPLLLLSCSSSLLSAFCWVMAVVLLSVSTLGKFMLCVVSVTLSYLGKISLGKISYGSLAVLFMDYVLVREEFL
jgi:hypothetical protein